MSEPETVYPSISDTGYKQQENYTFVPFVCSYSYTQLAAKDK